MAGFDKSVVVAALEVRLNEAREQSKERHKTALGNWENERATIQRAKKNLRQAVRDLTEGKIEIEAFAKRLADSDRGYRSGWLHTAKNAVPKPPVLEKSKNEVAIERLIGLAKGSTGDQFTLNELKTLGILGWVKA